MSWFNDLISPKPAAPKVKFWVEFVPKKNITTYELALATKFLTTTTFYKTYSADYHQLLFKGLDKKVQRHFKTRLE